MAAVQLKFLVHTQDQKTQKQKDLLQSEARSHARRISHRKDRNQKQVLRTANSSHEPSASPALSTATTPSYTPSSISGQLARTLSQNSIRTSSSDGVGKICVEMSSIDLAISGSPEVEPDMSPTGSSPAMSPWQWSDGLRTDPFDCIPWAKDYRAEADFRTRFDVL